MINYTSEKQLKIEEFVSSFEFKISPNNRWAKLAVLLPWDTLAQIYHKNVSLNKGRKSVNSRVVIGAMIIKHLLNLSDEDVILLIQENPSMQYFLGLDTYHSEPLFSPSLFVEIRKRMGSQTFTAFNDTILRIAFPEKQSDADVEDIPNKGKLQIDATVADQYIKYPNDLDLLNSAREKLEKIIDLLYPLSGLKTKPRTYRKELRKKYLNTSKKKNKSAKEIRKAVRLQLNGVKRNLGHIDKMLDKIEGEKFPLKYKYQRQLMIITTLYHQQKEMYDERKHTVSDRIVSISQPHVRPIVRGKQGKKKVEFGSKIGLSLIDGYARIDTLSWDAYNESHDLQRQAEAYKGLFGYYPELIQADEIYATNANRKWCKERNIRITAKPKGRPAKKTASERRKAKIEFNERNHIEGKFGQAKQGYRLNEVKAKLRNTSEAWVGMVVFVLNIVKLAQENNFSI
jgi:hypothetical protein